MFRMIVKAIRQQWKWWHLNDKAPAPRIEPPERNAYPGLAWDSPLRRREMETARMNREDWSAA